MVNRTSKYNNNTLFENSSRVLVTFEELTVQLDVARPLHLPPLESMVSCWSVGVLSPPIPLQS